MAKSSKPKTAKNIMKDSSGESDSDVEAFTQLFMAKAKSVPKQEPMESRHGMESESSDEDAYSDASDCSDKEAGADDEITRSRISPSEDSELSASESSVEEESGAKHTASRTSSAKSSQLHERRQVKIAEGHVSDSDDGLSGDDYKRARSRMSPSEGSESESGSSDSEESDSESPQDKSSTQEHGPKDEEDSDDSDESMDSDDDSESNVQPDLEALRKEIADVPFEDLQKLKQKIGVKAYNEAMHGVRGGRSGSFKRANKNRPMEMTSKKPVRRFREIVSVKKRDVRDPRFDDMSGKYYDTFFKNAYGFLSDVKEREKQALLKKLKKEKDEEKKSQIQYLINRMNQQEAAERDKERRLTQNKEIKKKEQELVRQGKNPFHLKKGDRRKLELAEKFRELKRSGKVDKYLAKKRKKNAQKEKKKLPNRQTVFA